MTIIYEKSITKTKAKALYIKVFGKRAKPITPSVVMSFKSKHGILIPDKKETLRIAKLFNII